MFITRGVCIFTLTLETYDFRQPVDWWGSGVSIPYRV
jgi:hypothetical protein